MSDKGRRSQFGLNFAYLRTLYEFKSTFCVENHKMRSLSKLSVLAKVGVVSLGLAFLAACDSAEERIEAHYKRGMELVAEGDFVKARLEFQSGLTLSDQHVPSLFELAKVEQRLKHWKAAIGVYLRVVDTAPEHVEARIGLTNLLLLAGQLDEALKFANQAYGLAPDKPEVLVLKAAVALKLGNAEEAVQFADMALERDPGNADALMVRAAERMNAEDPAGALPFLNRGEGPESRNVALQLFRLRVLSALEDREGIEGVLVKLIEFFPDNKQFRYGLARWYDSTDRKADAERVLREFATTFPKDTGAGLTLVRYVNSQRGAVAAREELVKLSQGEGDKFSYNLALAELIFSQGEADEAFALLNTVIADEKDPTNADAARILLARMKANQNQIPEAESLLKSVLENDDKNTSALTVRASILVVKKQYEAAAEDLRLALSEDPESISTLRLIARVHELNGSSELAEENFVKAVRLSRFEAGVSLEYVQFLLRYGKTDLAERVLTEARNASPGNRQILTQLANLKLQRQDWLGAQDIAEALRKTEDPAGIADRIQAEVLAGQDKFEESNEYLKASLGNAEQTAPVARYIRNLLEAGKVERATAFLNEILETNPENVSARVLLAAVYEREKQLDKAEEAYKLAVEHDKDGVAGLQAMSRFYLRSARIEDAEKVLTAAVEQHSSDVALRLLLAGVYERTGRPKEAIAQYEILFEASPQSSVVANNLASLLAEYGTDDASLEKAHSIASRFRSSEIPHFLDTLGWVYYRQGKFEQAVTLLKRAAQRLTDMEIVHYHLGMAYKEMGRKDLAIESLETAVKLAEGRQFPQLEQAKTTLAELNAAAAEEQ